MSIQGISPPQFTNSARSAESVISRKIIVNSWNTNAVKGVDNGYKRVTSPFPAIYGLTDYLGRQDSSCDAPNPIQKSRFIRDSRMGFIRNCDTTGVKSGGSNPKYVPDSSDYIRFKRLMQINKTYNDNKLG